MINRVFSDRFKSARLLNGFSLQDLSDKLENKVTRQALHKYEKGEVIPDSHMLALLANALNVRPDFFFREFKAEIGDIEFRKLKKLPAKDEYRIIEQVKEYVERYLELEEIIGIKTSFHNPLAGMPVLKSFEDVETAAQKLRKSWNLGSDPIFNCLELLEDNHIKVILIDAGPDYDGMQTMANGDIPVIAINKDKIKSADRKRFTALHELGHLVLPLKGVDEKMKEKYCHQFAAALLLPRKTAERELGNNRNKLMIQELGALKKQYGISIQAMIMRLKDLSIISENYAKQFFFYMNQMDWIKNEPIEYAGVEESNRFEQLLFRALAEELVSMSKAASLSNLTLAQFREKTLLVS